MNSNLKITGFDPSGVNQGNTVHLALGNCNGLKEKNAHPQGE